ncbi:unnamed protein product, partial [Mesorhabditis belari]|uniref:Glycosyltransferase family 92 protein n=1 Tax=Mesorhabditis belari TaxID=2138241 RepID=A0AAF3JBG3_9BILA
MKLGSLVVSCVCFLWICYITYYALKYEYLLNVFDDLSIVSSTLYKEPSPHISILFVSRRGEVDNSRILLALQEEHDYERQMEIVSGKVFLNDPSKHLIVGNVALRDESSQVSLTVEEKRPPLLTSIVGRVKLRVALRESEPVSRNVVTCMVPLIDRHLPEMITAISTAIAFGSFVHIPHSTLQSPFYRALVTFEKAGYARLSPWVRLAKLANFDPNDLLDRDYQAAPFLDCFLLYRQSANFLIFSPNDEFVIPRLQPNYLKEFLQVFNQTDERLLIYNLKRVRTFEYESLSGPFLPLDVLRKTGYTDSLENRIRIGMPSRMNEAKDLFDDLVFPSKFYGTENAFSFMENGLSGEVLEKVDRAWSKIHENPMYSHAWEVLAEDCSVDPILREWICDGHGCMIERVRYESLYGAFYYNVHQAYKIQFKKRNCSEVDD